MLLHFREDLSAQQHAMRRQNIKSHGHEMINYSDTHEVDPAYLYEPKTSSDIQHLVRHSGEKPNKKSDQLDDFSLQMV